MICAAVARALSTDAPRDEAAPSRGAGQTRAAQLQLPDAPELVRDRSGAFLRVRFVKVSRHEADAHLLEPFELEHNWPEAELLSRPAGAAAAAHVRASRARASADDALPPAPAMAARSAAPSETDDGDGEDDAIEECYVQVRSGRALESSRWQYVEKSALLIARNYSTRELPLPVPVARGADGSRFPFLFLFLSFSLAASHPPSGVSQTHRDFQLPPRCAHSQACSNSERWLVTRAERSARARRVLLTMRPSGARAQPHRHRLQTRAQRAAPTWRSASRPRRAERHPRTP